MANEDAAALELSRRCVSNSHTARADCPRLISFAHTQVVTFYLWLKKTRSCNIYNPSCLEAWFDILGYTFIVSKAVNEPLTVLTFFLWAVFFILFFYGHIVHCTVFGI